MAFCHMHLHCNTITHVFVHLHVSVGSLSAMICVMQTAWTRLVSSLRDLGLRPPQLSRQPAATQDQDMVAAFAAHIDAVVGPCVRVAASAATTFRRVQRLFFLAEGQDMTRFLVTKLGVVKYPPYRRDLQLCTLMSG